jgi:hypothetical protein
MVGCSSALQPKLKNQDAPFGQQTLKCPIRSIRTIRRRALCCVQFVRKGYCSPQPSRPAQSARSCPTIHPHLQHNQPSKCILNYLKCPKLLTSNHQKTVDTFRYLLFGSTGKFYFVRYQDGDFVVSISGSRTWNAACSLSSYQGNCIKHYSLPKHEKVII